MAIIIHLFYMAVQQLHINLCGRNVRVSHHGLDVLDRSAVFQQVQGERMAQRVGCDLLGNPRLCGCLLYTSNPEEAALLGQESYQRDMAAAIYNGLISFLEQREGEG